MKLTSKYKNAAMSVGKWPDLKKPFVFMLDLAGSGSREIGAPGNRRQTIRRKMCGRGGDDGNFEREDAIFDAGGESFYALWSRSLIEDFAGGEIYLPGVERTNDVAAGDDAVSERAAAVRAFVFDSEKAIAEIEDSDFVTGDLDGAAFTKRNGICTRDADPAVCERFALVHWNTFSIGSICTN